mmetsp:Transcript_24825/g.69881  ORF Transcript_24825/g.69881 Transcript_24825/m.69881 type:complete len:269 (-) Transcript_24825:961-1767(-)
MFFLIHFRYRCGFFPYHIPVSSAEQRKSYDKVSPRRAACCLSAACRAAAARAKLALELAACRALSSSLTNTSLSGGRGSMFPAWKIPEPTRASRNFSISRPVTLHKHRNLLRESPSSNVLSSDASSPKSPPAATHSTSRGGLRAKATKDRSVLPLKPSASADRIARGAPSSTNSGSVAHLGGGSSGAKASRTCSCTPKSRRADVVDAASDNVVARGAQLTGIAKSPPSNSASNTRSIGLALSAAARWAASSASSARTAGARTVVAWKK